MTILIKSLLALLATIGVAGSSFGMLQFYSGFHDMDLDFNHSLIISEFGKDPKNYGHVDTGDGFTSTGGDLYVKGAKKLFNGLGLLVLSSLLGGIAIGSLIGEVDKEKELRRRSWAKKAAKKIQYFLK